jgi:hypothetical protein
MIGTTPNCVDVLMLASRACTPYLSPDMREYYADQLCECCAETGIPVTWALSQVSTMESPDAPKTLEHPNSSPQTPPTSDVQEEAGQDVGC